jgi:hypothetical protein
MSKKVIRFQTHVTTFKSKLEKFKTSSDDTESFEKLKPDLVQILSLINELLKGGQVE